MSVMANGLKSMGYTQQTFDTNVTTAEMKSYLTSGVTTYYHTGHGNTNYVATADGSISSSSSTITAANTFIATCLTLSSTSWKNSFGSNAKNILGYTNYSYDITDDTIAQTVINQLKAGRSYAYAWYYANAGISSVSDRWLAYTREGSSITEYSARNGTRPQATAGVNWTRLANKVFTSPSLGNTGMLAPQALKSVQVQQTEVITVEPTTELNGLTVSSLSSDEAVDEAKVWLNARGQLFTDAQVDKVTPITKRVEANASTEIVGYQVKFSRIIDGIEVRGNGIADHINVLVGELGVEAASIYWPAVSNVTASRIRSNVLSTTNALRLAATQISNMLKGNIELHFNNVKLVYGTKGPMNSQQALVPAYEFTSTEGLSVVIDATSGTLLR